MLTDSECIVANLMSSPDRGNLVDGDLRRLTRLIMAAIVFFGLVLLAVIAYAGWSSNQIATERERTLLENALNQSIARVLNEQKSVAWWDDSVLKITDEAIDLDFVDANFGIFLTETYGQDEVYILNGDDHPLYSYFDAKRQEPSGYEARRPTVEALIAEARRGQHSNLRNRPDTFSESQSNYRILAGALRPARWAGHIVSVDGRPAVVAALTIVPNVDMSLLKGTPNLLLSIKYIDEAFTSEIGRSLLLNDLSMTPEIAQGDGVVSEAFVGDDGVPAGFLSWTTKRPGQVLLTVILPLVAFGIFGTGVLANTMFKRLKSASEELARRESQARHEAKHDALSGLPNRVRMVEEIERFLYHRTTKRNNRRAVAAYIDIDRFKDINDTLGHAAGDQLIKAVGQRLKARLRPQDFLSRFGGDEFVILGASAGPEASTALAERVAQAFATPFSINDQSIRVTASVGLSVAPDDGVSADELMRHADIALYEAKNGGRDRAVLFSAEMAEKVEHRRSIEVDLRAAFEANQLRLHYQPIISCGTGAIVGVEALLRWRHPVHGEMSPVEFIPIAENSGLLPALGEWVLDRAMKDSKRWPELEVAVNLSPVQFRHVNLGATLRELVAKNGVQPERFVLEITEGVLLEATNHTSSILETIRAMGFKTALDDFGTRYSSLVYLCNFKFDKIKIDRSFVSKISRVDTSRIIVESVVKLGRALGMDIVAEGVETESEAVMMTNFGCTELQGFYFSKALAADEIAEVLNTFEPKRFAQAPRSLHVVTTRGANG
jgi:diguanylate cyclase (GGDEF)-like protein